MIIPIATIEDIPNPSPTNINSLNSVSCKPLKDHFSHQPDRIPEKKKKILIKFERVNNI